MNNAPSSGMNIIIIGAGIGGLLTYLALQKHLSSSNPTPLTIKIYESHRSPLSTNSNIGGGLGLAPNGQRAISTVSKKAVAYIQERGYPVGVYALRHSSGRLLGTMSAGRPERYPGLGQTMLRRAVLHQALLDEMPEEAVAWGKKVKLVTETEEGVRVEFEDGETQIADLVIGADGVRSVVRQCIFDDNFPATYDGLTGVGGFIHVSRLPECFCDSLSSTESVNMSFGSHGSFGYSMVSPPTASKDKAELLWFSVYESPTPPSRSLDPSIVRDQLLERHGSWKSPYDSADAKVYESIIKLGCDPSEKSLLILPRYVVPRLPKWTVPSGKIILIGDAAHAMPPDSGQGVSCAAEDAVAVSLLLQHYLVSRQLGLSEGLAKTAEAYENIRMGRVGKILDIAARRRESKRKLSPWMEWIRNWSIYVMCKLPESFSDDLFGYDVEAEVKKYLVSHV